MKGETNFDINWMTLWRILIFALIAMFLYFAREVVGVLLISIVISLGLDPFVSALERFKFPRLLGTFVIFLVGLLVFAMLVYFIAPIVLTETISFLETFNKTLSTIFGISLPQAAIKNLSLGIDKAFGVLTAANISIPGAIGSLVANVILIFATIMSSFYLTVEKDGTERLLRVIVPDAYERPILTVFSRFKVKIRRWFAAQLGLSLIVGGLVSVSLLLLGVRYPLVLGFLAAVFELVPIIGPILTGGIAFMVAVSDSLSLGLWALLVFFGIQQFENHVLVPLVMGRAMKVHPVLVIIALLAGGHVAGFVGVVLSVPIAVMAQEIFNYLSERKTERESSV